MSCMLMTEAWNALFRCDAFPNEITRRSSVTRPLLDPKLILYLTSLLQPVPELLVAVQSVWRESPAI